MTNMNKTPNSVHIEGGDVNESDADTNIPIKPGRDTDVTTKPMTNYNERLDEILSDHGAEQGEFHYSLKQAITSLIKELVAEAKPDRSRIEYVYDRGFNDSVLIYEQNLLKALEEV